MPKTKDQFIQHIHSLIYQIADINGKSPIEKMKLLAFSILVTIDGEAAGIPPFSLRPIDEDGNELSDISGGLHDLFCNYGNEK